MQYLIPYLSLENNILRVLLKQGKLNWQCFDSEILLSIK